MIWRHALRNAAVPGFTVIALSYMHLLEGSVLTETIFAWPGLGHTTMSAYFEKDMFLVATSVLLASVMLIIGNFIADILLAVNDPRIRYE